MGQFREMDARTTFAEQREENGGEPVVLAGIFTVPDEMLDGFEAAWAQIAAIMKRQPGCISIQLHRGIGGSGTYLNVATWQSVGHFRAAFENPEFQAKIANPAPGLVESPHLFRKVAVDGICVA